MTKIVTYTKIVVCSILTIICSSLVGQNDTCNIKILRGSSVSFHFNSYNRIQNGITYNDFTHLQLNFNDTRPTSQGWELTVRALQTSIEGSMTTFTLPLESIMIMVKKGGEERGPFFLGTTPLSIFDGSDATLNNEKVEISYLCGTVTNPNKMINKVPDYYVVDIEFTLEPKQ